LRWLRPGLAPFLGELADRVLLPAQQRVRRLLRAGPAVIKLPGRRARLPAQHPRMLDAEGGG